MSLLFYFKGQKSFVLVMIFLIIVNYFIALLIGRKKQAKNSNFKIFFLIIGIQFNLFLLIFYKYTYFLLQYVNPILNHINSESIHVDNVILVAEISFYTFHAISYLVDVYRGIKPQKNIVNMALYISFFPQLIAGPIIRYHTIAKQLDSRRVVLSDVSEGIQRFILGLSKKILIADKIGPISDSIFATPVHQIGVANAWLGVLCYALQIYFDFSGYSDMAIGLARIFGFHFLENFNYPYISQSITEFWRRWHISLSSWFRDYVYVPLGGNRKGNWRTYGNLLFVFLLCGLWHGANWNFIVWGLWYGMFLVLEKWRLLNLLNKLWKPFRHAYTLLVVLLGWVFFKSTDLPYAFGYFKELFFGIHKAHMQPSLFLYGDVIIAISAGVILSMPIRQISISVLNKTQLKAYVNNNFTSNPLVNIVCFIFLFSVLFLSTLQMSSTTNHPFLYFQF